MLWYDHVSEYITFTFVKHLYTQIPSTLEIQHVIVTQ